MLIDKQGNFGSIAGLPPAAMRYTEARMSPIAALLLDDLKLDTVDFIPTYDERHTEPTVLPSKFPNLLVNGSNGIAVGMATVDSAAQPGRSLRRADPRDRRPGRLDRRTAGNLPRPRFSHRRHHLGRSGIRRGYHTGRSTITLRARARIEEHGKGRFRIVVSEIPFQQARDRVEERIAELVERRPDQRHLGHAATKAI